MGQKPRNKVFRRGWVGIGWTGVVEPGGVVCPENSLLFIREKCVFCSTTSRPKLFSLKDFIKLEKFFCFTFAWHLHKIDNFLHPPTSKRNRLTF